MRSDVLAGTPVHDLVRCARGCRSFPRYFEAADAPRVAFGGSIRSDDVVWLLLLFCAHRISYGARGCRCASCSCIWRQCGGSCWRLLGRGRRGTAPRGRARAARAERLLGPRDRRRAPAWKIVPRAGRAAPPSAHVRGVSCSYCGLRIRRTPPEDAGPRWRRPRIRDLCVLRTARALSTGMDRRARVSRRRDPRSTGARRHAGERVSRPLSPYCVAITVAPQERGADEVRHAHARDRRPSSLGAVPARCGAPRLPCRTRSHATCALASSAR